MNNVEIIAIGTELLMGETLDTNSNWLATRLPDLGLSLRFVTQVADNKKELVDCLARAQTRSDYILTIGGLGPTRDDLTRESIAEVMQEPLAIDQEIERELRQYFSERGMEYPSTNQKQAAFIPSSSFLVNYHGTAPGWWVTKHALHIIALPGPPAELQAMWINAVEPWIKKLLPGQSIITKTFKTLGVSESKLDELISELHCVENPYLGTYAKADGVQVRLIARAKTEQEAQDIIGPVASQLETLLRPYIWGIDDDSLEEMIIDILNTRGLTLSVAESVSEGYIQSRLNQVAGVQSCFMGGVLISSQDSLARLGVESDILNRYRSGSSQVAEATAKLAMRYFRSDVALSLVGEFPMDANDAKVGTFYLCAMTKGKTRHNKMQVPLRKDIFRRRVAANAFLFLHQTLTED
jgi:nicotinamide-nucleotide amidase